MQVSYPFYFRVFFFSLNEGKPVFFIFVMAFRYLDVSCNLIYLMTVGNNEVV